MRIRPYTPADREFVLSLAPRLLVGAAPWLDPERMLVAVRQWITDSITKHGGETMVFVAEDASQKRLGFVSVAHKRHFTGEPLAYIGELAVAEAVEGRGVGRELVRACEQWAHVQGYGQCALETGFANERGRRFYERLGFKEESVRLVRVF
ncbi:MAG TPA: GNAT family N-acetyltransferase [Ktedonobacteraceae bacterium]